MLRLINIVKDYKTSDITVNALKGIGINFRKNEFVSVLGPSGCGKTTLLNIIGGLDGFTDGDMFIEGRSTKKYTSRDWDRYRNSSVGFIFQSYNLIPHLNVLQNVELALTISGVGRKEKRKMATVALNRVGLGTELKKKPSEMSGGQMQRVAIARAIVNNPEIILADEPTGALDTKTSEQVMDILKEIAADKLVIMVTHNPDLAYRYSTRIVEMQDGEIIGDSRPFNDEEEEAERLADTSGNAQTDSTFSDNAATSAESVPHEETARKNARRENKKPRSSMSFFTALGLSGRNLTTKKGRTALTSFAGSIGIIGIALVLSLSNGFNLYMDDLEETTLSSMPVQIMSVGIQINVDEAMTLPSSGEDEFPDGDTVIPTKPNDGMNGVHVNSNFITEEYVNYVNGLDKSLLSSIQFKYSMDMKLLAKNDDAKKGGFIRVKTRSIRWQELLWDDFMKKQYDVLAGGYPGSEEGNEVLAQYDENYQSYTDDSQLRAHQAVLVVSSYNTIETGVLEELGYKLERDTETNTYAPIKFEDLLGKRLKVMHNDDYYEYSEDDGLYHIFSENIEEKWNSDKNTDVTIVGVMRVKEGVMVPFLDRGVAYTEDLSKIVLDNAYNSQIAEDQRNNPDKNVLTGNDFSEDFSSVISVFGAYGINEATLVMMMKQVAQDLFNDSTDPTAVAILNGLKDCSTVNDVVELFKKNGFSPQMLKAGVAIAMSTALGIDSSVTMRIMNSGYETALQKIGASRLPSAIYIYPNSFDNKAEVLKYLDEYNTDKSSIDRVVYTDLASTFSDVLVRVVNIVSYILIAFAAISLIVSSIMIAIITYISVLERTTEIGVLRSIGARKIDVANVFNAETLLIGLTSGVIGVLVAWILDFPLNFLIYSLVEYAPKSFAVLNPLHAVILIALSIVLTVLSGLLPAFKASKCDPVKALRSNG